MTAPAPSMPIAILASGEMRKGGMVGLLCAYRTLSQTVTRPYRTFLERGHEFLCKSAAPQDELKIPHSRLHAPEPAPRRRDQRGRHVDPEALAQRRTQIPNGVGKSEGDRLGTGPVLAGEQGLLRTLEARTAAFLYQLDEPFMDFPLHALEALHILRVLGQKRIEHRLVLAGGIEPSLDAELVDQLGETERTADHPNRADDRRWVANDLVRGAGNHVAARSRHVFGKRDHRAAVLRRKLANAAVDQMRLHRRATGRVDQERDRARITHAECALQGTRNSGER